MIAYGRKHPPGLPTLFLTEMWERFSFYGIRALLILYMINEFRWGDERAYGVLGAYLSLVWMTPLIGGWLSDHFLGNRKAIIYGTIAIAIGSLCLALPGEDWFFLGLGVIVVGTGLLKSNISTLLGQLYERNDTRRDAGFTLFYVGINLGGALAGLCVGFIGQTYGWRCGFATASFIMICATLTFLRGQIHFGDRGLAPAPPKITRKIGGILSLEHLLVLIALACAPVAAFLISHHHLMNGIMPGVATFSLGVLSCLAFSQGKAYRKQMFVIMALMFFHTAFFALFEQAASSINLFTDRNVNRWIAFNWFGKHVEFEVLTTWFQSLNPLFIIVFGPMFAALWEYLGRKGLDVPPPVKFSLALVQVSLGFGALAYGAVFADAHGQSSMIWVVLAYLLHTTGELCIMPIGMSMITRLAPVHFISLLMGIWFLSMSMANYLASVIAKCTAVLAAGQDKVENLSHSLIVYQDIFTQLTYWGIGTAIALFVLSPFMRSVFVAPKKKR